MCSGFSPQPSALRNNVQRLLRFTVTVLVVNFPVFTIFAASFPRVKIFDAQSAYVIPTSSVLVDSINANTCANAVDYFPSVYGNLNTSFSYIDKSTATSTEVFGDGRIGCIVGTLKYTAIPPGFNYIPPDQLIGGSHLLSCEGMEIISHPDYQSRAYLQTTKNAYCECPQFPEWSWDGEKCVKGAITNKPQLTLTPVPQPPPDPRPKGAEGKDGRSTLVLIAKVTEGGAPKAGIALTFKSDVVPMTGGHGHHDANRPKGSVPASGITDSNGEIKITFQASEVAGSHTITATCNDCTNKTVNKNVDVLVPDLAPISPNPSQNADGSYQYAFTAVDPGHVGTSGGRQRGEYYLTAQAATNLNVLVGKFAKEGWGIVGFNDASLNWGGTYDLNNNWSKPHSEHKLGEEIDISFTRAGNIISKQKQYQFYQKFCEGTNSDIPFTILHHYVLLPHFHVRLIGKKSCGRTAN